MKDMYRQYRNLRAQGLCRNKAVDRLSKEYHYSGSYILKLLTKAKKMPLEETG